MASENVWWRNVKSARLVLISNNTPKDNSTSTVNTPTPIPVNPDAIFPGVNSADQTQTGKINRNR